MSETSLNLISCASVPLVTVAMPIYNAGRHLRQAVKSIVRQTFVDWELLIIDDGSTDNAIESIADINDNRVRIFRDGKNKGLAPRLNEAIDMARGRYLARMDHDDVSFPERLMWQVAELDSRPQLDLIATRAITIDDDDNAIGILPYRLSHDVICARPWIGFCMPHPTWMGRLEWFVSQRYADPAPYLCEDQELLLRSYRNSRFDTLDKILFAYRVKGEINWGKLARTRFTVINIQIKYFLKIRQLHFILFSLFVFLVRICKDLFVFTMPSSQKLSDKINPDVLREWRTVVKNLRDGV